LCGGAHMWVSFSPDFLQWGDPALLMEAREGSGWDSHKIGLGPPPIETPHGWLVLYHGTHLTASGPIYRIGVALLDLEDPTIVLRRSDQSVFGPREPYECDGDVGRVVFPSGWIVDELRDEVRLYYGAADTRIGLATAKLSAVLDYVRACPTG
jgi:beta-1,4-mannooligosaccharide/beta-1,4-mannosyl-N-acetylglucosamine phosphorylase